ncbi:hypothetical protein CLOSTMETH_02272 [[Clostridium] methylpentosum DSM 5476]|uniref:Uncharacterized protein n=1 Tax=[Clostridium] methylpentosum DSM 5476 TaxID=537013 RepID=C0EEI6_9FIRM|nr:hypothetical protein CLOSTMETH_02272 [[Clostridium] methylpentosum DSM 5476]
MILIEVAVPLRVYIEIPHQPKTLPAMLLPSPCGYVSRCN